MKYNNYIIIGIFFLFLFSSKTRATASVLLFTYVAYYFGALQFHGLQRYSAIATLEALAGCYLIYGHHVTLHLNRVINIFGYHQDNSIAETYFILVFINIIGGVLYWHYQPPKYYDNMCVTLMAIQIIIMSWRVLKDGRIVDRCSLLHPLLSAFVGNINKRHSLLQAKQTKGKEAKET